VEAMDYLEFIARVVSHIPDKGQVTVRYYGLYANAKLSSLSSPTMQWSTGLSTTSSCPLSRKDPLRLISPIRNS
jgi:hypothetical protein